jgi:hypothetical protein
MKGWRLIGKVIIFLKGTRDIDVPFLDGSTTIYRCCDASSCRFIVVIQGWVWRRRC